MVPSAEEAAIFAARRARVMETMGRRGVMLLPAAPERIRTGDVYYPYRQENDLDYVTGFPEPETVCVLAPEAAEKFVLFVRPHDPERAIWVGPRAGIEGAVAHYGADAAYPIADLEKELPRFLAPTEQVWLNLTREDALAQRLLSLLRRLQGERPRAGTAPAPAIRDPGEILHEMRLRKEPSEIARLRAAIAIACEAHAEAMRRVRPGMYEYEVEALIDYTFRRRGATGPAYPSIVAAGPNATVLHYTSNDSPLGTEELLLIDAGAERAGYCADVTRTFPVGRRFAPAHRDLYDAVLAAQLAAIAAVRPGATLEGLHTIAVRVLAEALIGLGLLEGSVDAVLEKELHKRFYMHRTSHWLGRDVHDVGRYRIEDTPRPLDPGMVFTIEPGVYIGADVEDVPPAFRGVGIRIEDDILVTEAGCEVLSAAAPKQVAEIEALRAEGH